MVNWNGDAAMGRIRKAAMLGVVRGTELVHQEAVRLIQSPPKTGRVYQRRGVLHQASAPGEPPASDTGALVQMSGTRYEPDQLTGVVTFHAAYAAALEFGTVRIEPRPFLRPALAHNIAQIEKNVADEVKKVFEVMG